MKKIIGLLFIVAAITIVAAPSWAGKPRKLPVKAYIQSAKIEILSGDPERYKLAEAMLDSLFLHYGHHAEGLYLYSQMMVDYISKTPSPQDKLDYVAKMKVYIDSLHLCCENDDIKKKYRNKCDEFLELSDSVKVKYWREFYNAAIEQLKMVGELQGDLGSADDEGMTQYLQDGINANFDSCLANFNLAMAIEPADNRTYIGLGSAYQQIGDFEKSIEWKIKGLEFTADSSSLLESIAYDYTNLTMYEEAIPFLSEYIRRNPEDLTGAYNLTICLNNVGQYDSAKAVYDMILVADPGNVTVLNGVGRYWNEMGRLTADSVKAATDAGDEAAADAFKERRAVFFDSAQVAFGKAFMAKPEDEFAAEMYALTSALGQKWDEAITAFTKLTEMQPDNADNFISLGDCLINTKEFEQAAVAYEKAVEIKPDRTEIWQQLADIYKELKMPAKEAEARKHL